MYFKQGACTKGAKCKFSHDLAIERKAEKRSLYDDLRGDNANKENGESMGRNSMMMNSLIRCLVFRDNGQLG